VNVSKPPRFDGDVAVRVVNGFGYEEEEIFHRPDKGREALLSVVFITLAESGRRKQRTSI
jgi:hypothetical protein